MGQGQIPGGNTAGQARALRVTEEIVAVDDTETLISAANSTLRNVVVQNNGPDVVQIFMTTGLAFGAGGVQLAPATATAVGGVWSAAQCGVGTIQGDIFAICDTGNAANLSVTREF